MTKNKFIKTLRSWCTPETIIKNYTNIVAHYGGAASYEDIYKILIRNISTEMLRNYTPNRFDIKPYDFNLDETTKDNYLSMYAYGAKVVEPMYVRRVVTL